MNPSRVAVRQRSRVGTVVLAFLIIAKNVTANAPTAVSYQGYLEENSLPAEGLFDFEFRLFDSPTAGTQIGGAIVQDDLDVTDGLFSTSLDFGEEAFDASPRYLEIGVRPGDSTGSFSTLDERVEFRSVPFSHLADHATTADKATMAQAATSAHTPTNADDAQTLQGLGPGDFANAGHKHSQLATPDNTVSDALSIDNSTNATLKGDLLFNNQNSISNPGVDILLFERNGFDESVGFHFKPSGTAIEGGGDSTSFVVKAKNGTAIAPHGNELALVAGNGADTGSKNDGGDVRIQAGNGQDEGKDGDIRLIPGAGEKGGDVIIEGQILLTEALRDGDDKGGNPGQFLSSTGTGTQWTTPVVSSLSTPDGTNPSVVQTFNNNDVEVGGETLLQNGVTFPDDIRASSQTGVTGPELRLKDTASNSWIRFVLSSNGVNLFGSPISGSFLISPDAKTPSNNGTTLRIQGGRAGAGAEGGDLFLKGGLAQSPGNHDGGDIVFASASGVGTGDGGDVLSFADIGIHNGNPTHPIHVGTQPSNGNGAHLTIGGVWMNGSDRDSKIGFEEVDTKEILRKVAELPVTAWRYKSEDEDVRHIGPTAQDFMAAFELGESDKHIGTVDALGVALAAIQELHAEVQSLQSLRVENEDLRARLSALEAEK